MFRFRLVWIFFLWLVCALAAESRWHNKAISPPHIFHNTPKKQAKLANFNEIDREINSYLQSMIRPSSADDLITRSFYNRNKKGDIQFYRVHKGDSVWSISRKYKVSPKSILDNNSRLKRRPLYIGEKIVIVIGLSKTASLTHSGQKKTPIYHKVSKGETLYSISKKYKTSIDQLRKNNRLAKDQTLAVGKKLKVSQETNKSYRQKKLFKWPLQGRVTSGFGRRVNPFLRSRRSYHKGIDIAAELGTPFKASRAGVVVRSKRLSGYGNCIFILHPGEYISVYAHNKRNLVRKGDVVKQEQVIGLIGRTGVATGPHLHFEVRKLHKPIDPIQAFKMYSLVKVRRVAIYK